MSGSAISSLGAPAASSLPGAGVLDQRLSFDVQGVDALRHAVRTAPQEGMKQASRQFEVMFMQMLLKSMRDATPSEGGLFNSSQEKTYTAMLDQQLSQTLSGRGLGLAEAMLAQLSRNMGSDGAAPASAPPGLADLHDLAGPRSGSAPAAQSLPGAPAALFAARSSTVPAAWPPAMPDARTSPLAAALDASRPAPAAAPSWAPPAGTAATASGRAGDLSFYQAATAGATLSRSVLPQAHVEQFVSRMLPAAQRASQASGVPAQLIMAQAALESGWGRREIRTEDGRPSHNLFGIKADKAWKGPVVETTTTEYANGVAHKTQARFRAYGSYEESFTDYARFLRSNPRYAEVLATPDAAQAAHGLQRAGYATDPQYGGKLVRIMKQMG